MVHQLGDLSIMQRVKAKLSNPTMLRLVAPFRGVLATRQGSSNFAASGPSPQNVANIFLGEWSSKLPGLKSDPGHADLFNDPRIFWMNSLFKVNGKTILELGPLEGAHTKMMVDLGAASVTAVEGNQRAFLKCLCVKELFDIHNAKFLLGDFMQYFSVSTPKFDITVASGVLYHMNNPIDLLSHLVRTSDRIFIWTHYFDEKINLFERHMFGKQKIVTCDGYDYCVVERAYSSRSVKWTGFSGGPDRQAVWLTRQSLLDFFTNSGFYVEIGFDEELHQNGPAIAICATRQQ